MSELPAQELPAKEVLRNLARCAARRTKCYGAVFREDAQGRCMICHVDTWGLHQCAIHVVSVCVACCNVDPVEPPIDMNVYSYNLSIPPNVPK